MDVKKDAEKSAFDTELFTIKLNEKNKQKTWITIPR